MAVRLFIGTEEPLATAAVKAIRTGDLGALKRLLEENPTLATARLGLEAGMSRTLLHIATDWPGHYPNGAATVAVLVDAGADVNPRFAGPHSETPLHWIPGWEQLTPLDAAARSGATDLVKWLHHHGAKTASELREGC